MVERQPRAADVGGSHPEPGVEAAQVGQYRVGGQRRGFGRAGGPGGALQDRRIRVRGRRLGAAAAGIGRDGKVFDDHLVRAGRVQGLQCVQVGAVAQDGAHADPGEAGQRGVGPTPTLGPADRPGQDRDAGAGQPGAHDGGDELEGRLADQSQGGGSVPVEQPRGDALGQSVHLRPPMAAPGRRLAVEDHQIAAAGAHRGRQRCGQLTHRGFRGVPRRSRPAGRRRSRSSAVPLRSA